MSETVFTVLNKLNVNDHVEQKKTGTTSLSYLSWVWSWSEVKKLYPNASYEIKMFDNKPYVYDDNTGYMVFTSVTIEGITHDMWLPVMDGRNEAMLNHEVKHSKVDRYGNKKEWVTEKATMFDINKTIMRCLTKNLAMHGLGLYIYAGEDLPEDVEEEKPTPKTKPVYKVSTNDYTPSDNFLALETLVNSYNAEIRKDVLQLCLKALESKNENEIADKLDRLRKYLNTKGIEV